ncbi:MAG: GNAT family N-acetyltransferase [Alphaproteobacteria bacterium]|nr:GNAT family N-acetyltransferase [Alphaproteobacteria bacterium]
MTEPRIAYRPATAGDFEPVLAVRIRALRPHLERVGRFDPDRARRYFADTFAPEHLRLIDVDGGFAGCVSFRREDGWFTLEHFYLDDAFQGRGIGGRIMADLIAEAEGAGLPIRLGVLKGSPAARFYARHGFVWMYDEPFDDYYERPAERGQAASAP